MKLGVAIHLGTLLNDKLLAWATELRGRGVSHCAFANAEVDTVAVAKGDTVAMQAWAAKVGEQLAALSAMGMTVGVRPKPMILEQVKLGATDLEEEAWRIIANVSGGAWRIIANVSGGDWEWKAVASNFRAKYHKIPNAITPDFTARNTSLESAKLLIPVLDEHNLVVQHECHDTSNGDVRRWATRRLGSAATFYYGFKGLWNKFGADFPTYDLPHTVHVALNAAGAGDASSPGAFPGPAACTPKDIRIAAEAFDERMPKIFPTLWNRHVHINVLADTPVATMERMIYAAAVCQPDVIMLRSVFGANDLRGPEGNTLTDPADEKKHWVTPNVLQAIEECAKWMT